MGTPCTQRHVVAFIFPLSRGRGIGIVYCPRVIWESMPMWGKEVGGYRIVVRVVVVLALGALMTACFQPLYGNNTLPAGDSVRDKLASVDVANIPALNGTPDSRLAVALRNALMYDFNNGAAPTSATHRLQVTLSSSIATVIVDVASGRPDSQVEVINASFTLTEIATNRVVLRTSTHTTASFDIPGSAQRFAQQRAWHNAEDRAIAQAAESIRNRLASFFVAGT
jgi:LPS-assembly lipoprotein